MNEMMREMKISYAFNNRVIFRIWDEVSGAGPYTIRKFFREGKLYITVNSSVVRTQLNMQKAFFLERINERLAEDALLDRSPEFGAVVKELIIK